MSVIIKTQRALLNYMKGLVDTNDSNETSSLDIQMCDSALAKSLHHIAEEGFSDSSTYMNTTGYRYVNGNQVSLTFTINFLDNSTASGTPYIADTNTISNIIPQNYQGYKWFKAEEITILVDEVTGGFSQWGQVILNDLSSYNGGVASTGDEAKFNLFVVEEGVQAYYDFGVPELSTVNDYNLDQELFPALGAPEYLVRSPKDISVSGLNITIKNAAELYGDTSTNKFGTIKFNIKGTLL